MIRGLCWICCLWLLWTPLALAESLSDRVSRFPNWREKPAVELVRREDLAYPEWMAGTWKATSTLEQMEAPLAPTLKTPGFEGNRPYLQRPLEFQVRFQAVGSQADIVADREYNGENIANAYLGNNAVEVTRDPDNPNRQMTELPSGQRLVSVVRGRQSERPAEDRFLATEVSYQVFRTPQQIYFNEVETTTDYHQRSRDRIEAQQLTAIYLSPKDPDYFRANGQPVALYRYDLQLDRIEP